MLITRGNYAAKMQVALSRCELAPPLGTSDGLKNKLDDGKAAWNPAAATARTTSIQVRLAVARRTPCRRRLSKCATGLGSSAPVPVIPPSPILTPTAPLRRPEADDVPIGIPHVQLHHPIPTPLRPLHDILLSHLVPHAPRMQPPKVDRPGRRRRMVRREHRKLTGQALDRLEHELGPVPLQHRERRAARLAGQPTSRSGDAVMVSVIPRMSR